jgi:hypothetical protein
MTNAGASDVVETAYLFHCGFEDLQNGLFLRKAVASSAYGDDLNFPFDFNLFD